MNARRVSWLVLVVLVVVPLALFYLQNSATEIDLVFRLPGVSWYLAKATSAPLLLGIFLLTGGLLSGAFFGGGSLVKSREIRELSRRVSGLEDDLALARLDRESLPTERADESTKAPVEMGALESSVEDATDFDELI